MRANVTMTSVHFTRGTRSYLRAADMLAVAPVTPAATAFDVRFRKVITQAGFWRKPSGVGAADILAELTITDPSGSDVWVFVPDLQVARLQVLQDVPEAEFVSSAVLRDGRFVCPLVGTVGFWDQLIGIIRCGGASVYPGRRWQVAALSVGLWPLPQSLAGRTLSLEIARSRGPLVALRFGLDGISYGTVSLFALPSEADHA